MKITRRFSKQGQDAFGCVSYDNRTSRISNPDGSVVFEMTGAEIPREWSQLATDIMVSKYFRKAGVPQIDPATGQPLRDESSKPITGPEKSARQVIHRLAGCWRDWGQRHGYFDTPEDGQAFYDELVCMMLKQACAPNSPQWFNTGLHFAYGITGPSQGHYYCDPATGEVLKSPDAYSRPQPHACFIQSVSDDLVNPGGIMDLWTREARLFKYGSGTGSNFSKLRGEDEPLSGGGKSSGLMSFLKIGDRAAGAIKSGGTTRRAAKMVCLDLDHPDIESFVNWKVREELKVACLNEGFKHIPKDQQELARKLRMKLDYDFNGEAYFTVSGQNSNNSVRIPNRFFKAVEEDGNWTLTWRINGKKAKTIKARDLWEQISFAAWRCADPGVQYDDTINQWHTCPNSGRINASNPCVTGDTRILTPGGIWRRIDQMIHLPSRVVTNREDQQIQNTDGAFPTGTRPIVELRTAGGYTVKLTADHRVWTRLRSWVPAGNLTTADDIKLPSEPATVQQIGEPQDPRFFQMLGMLISTTNRDMTAIHLDGCLSAPEQIDDFSRYAAQVWATPAYADDYSNPLMLDDSEDGNTLTATLTHRRLLSRLGAYVRFDHGQRRLSDEAFTAGLAAQKHLLAALFTTDGQFDGESLVLHSDSARLLEDVQLLLLGFGVRCSVLGERLRIDPNCLPTFAEHISLLPGEKRSQLQSLPERSSRMSRENWEPVASVTPLGIEPVYDLTEPVTKSFIANGITVHNCSEYMFLDDTACNLASLNVLTFFDAETRSFDIEAFKHAARIWTIVLEISVLMASFPSEEIARRSYRYRTLGLGYANLGAMLMQGGIAYNSDKGRAICAALTAILTAESYACSAEMAAELGAFAGYADNRDPMLRVIRNHRRAAYNVAMDAAARGAIGEYQDLDIEPVGLEASQFAAGDSIANPSLLAAARECWDRALRLGELHGYRNAQTTVIAPTGTIGLLMDCDTTGVEPDFALVKFKKLAGGGYFKIANQSLRAALVNLGYAPTQITDILTYVMGTLTLDGAPQINRDTLRLVGFTEEELEKIEQSLPASFELSFAFSPWSLGAPMLQRLGITENEWQAPGFNLLQRLGFTGKQINLANDVICGRGTVEGAPHLKPEHLPVFDCANKCGKTGERFISASGHIRMMAAAQPFISGAISKTINLPHEASITDIQEAYFLSWKLGLKANALYRDGSKLSQPLNVKSDEELDKTEEDDADNVDAGREEVASQLASSAVAISHSDNLSPAPQHTVEKIIERIVERPLRRRLPDTRRAITHKFDVAGHEGYITVGLYEDGAPGEVFITMAKEGSTIGGLMDTIATLVSVALQYGVPVESLVRKFEHVRFEPSGMTKNREIPFAKSLTDYIFRWLAMEFIPGYRASNAPKRPSQLEAPVEPQEDATAVTPPSSDSAAVTRPKNGNGKGNGNGHGQHKPDAKPFMYAGDQAPRAPAPVNTAATQRLASVADPVSQQSSELQADAPACDVCGSITIRSGTCYKCLNCGNSMGCS